jgi:putative tryptophan/tyrosine transport system substrate-binding protein
MMKRREFITLLGGAAAAWPLAAHAQHAGGIRRIGVLMNLTAADPEGQARLAAFLQALQGLGWTDSHNVRIETRWSGGEPDRARTYAAELVALADVILADGGTTVGPLLKATRTVPIVFVNVTDPVGGGFVESLARPDGNASGFTLFEYAISANRQVQNPWGGGGASVSTARVAYDASGLGSCDSCHRLFFE